MLYLPELRLGDCIEVLQSLPDNYAKMAITSPPYHGKMRRYGGRGKMTDKQWSTWMADVISQCVRVCSGEVVVIANGCVQKGRYIPSCERLVVECYDRGIRCERPTIWYKNSPPSRKDWFTNDWEYCMVFGTKQDWNWEAIASSPKYKAGGDFRQRGADGQRKKGGKYPQGKLARPRDFFMVPPVVRATVGGGHLGSKLSHENEAPYPEKLIEPFILALSNEGDRVLDPFGGSGTTLSVSMQNGRRSTSIDNRESQLKLMTLRVAETIQRIN